MSARDALLWRLTVVGQTPISEHWAERQIDAVLHEAAERIRAHSDEWQEHYKHHWYEGQQDAANLIDPEMTT